MGTPAAADTFEIRNVLGAYCQAIDAEDYEGARDCYHHDAVDDHGLYRGDTEGLLVFFRRLGRSLAATSHMLGMPWITVLEDRAWAVTPLLHRMRAIRGDEALLQGYRYLDYLERRDGRWRIARRTVVLDWDQALHDDTDLDSLNVERRNR